MENTPDQSDGLIASANDERIRQHTNRYVRDLEMSSWHQAEIHVTAAGFWGTFQWIVGGAAAVFSAVASGTAFANYPLAAGILALLAAGSAAVVTALRPGDISSQHLKSAADFNSLQNDAGDLREFDLDNLAPDKIRREISRLGERWNELIARSPRVPRRLFKVTDKRYGGQGMYYFPKPYREDEQESDTHVRPTDAT